MHLRYVISFKNSRIDFSFFFFFFLSKRYPNSRINSASREGKGYILFTSFHPWGVCKTRPRTRLSLNEPTRAFQVGSRCTIRDIDIGPFPRGSESFYYPAELGFEDWHSFKCTMLLGHRSTPANNIVRESFDDEPIYEAHSNMKRRSYNRVIDAREWEELLYLQIKSPSFFFFFSNPRTRLKFIYFLILEIFFPITSLLKSKKLSKH